MRIILNARLGMLLAISIYIIPLCAIDFITISNPLLYETIDGASITFSGTSSQPTGRVRLTINNTIAGDISPDAYGNWSYTIYDLANGDYTITADLSIDTLAPIASILQSFTVQNADRISIESPNSSSPVIANLGMVKGSSSLPLTPVDISVDGTFLDTTTTDDQGNWEGVYGVGTNGAHTIQADLMVGGYSVASDTISINAVLPVTFPIGTTQLRFLDSDVPTTGSGSGPGFTYSASGSIVTINFIPAFTSIPSIIAAGQRTSGSSTITIAAVSTTAVSLAFSTGTQKIHFTASSLS